MKQLETKRLILRFVTRNDAQAVYDGWANDSDVTKYLTWNAHESISDTHMIMDYWIEEYKKDNCYRYGIERKEDRVLIGMIEVVGYHHGNPVIESCIGKKYWNCGYVYEALQEVIKELFMDGYKTIVVEAVRENIGSNRVIQKAGFEFVGSRETELSKIKQGIVTINSYRLKR